MSFIKRGDGKILTVIKSEEELTEEQKKVAKDLVEKTVKQSDLKKNQGE